MRQVIQDDKIGEITYEETFWTGKKTVYINGQPLNKVAKNTFETADGTKAELKGNFLTGATLTVGENQVRIVNPVKWYEIVMSVLPFILIMIWGNSTALCKIVPVIGGAIGGGISALLSATNVVIIKRVDKLWLKIVISVAMLAATFGVCCGLGYALVAALS